MSALEWLDAVRADLDAATPGPWRAALLDGVECEDGSSSYRGGIYPDYVGALPIILTNGVDRRDATLIASAPDRLDRMERALRGVLEMHAPFRIYELEADGTPKCWNGDESVLATCCESCTPDDTIEAAGDGEWTEDMPYVPWPCPTVTEIKEVLR